ncbi:MAG: hypothetical protein IPG93_24605 [Burkholderiales bacterium]|nr:hypothetical protein [Burkholderiales bacterium]
MRINPTKKELWAAAAALDGRSLTSWVEAVCDSEIRLYGRTRAGTRETETQKKHQPGLTRTASVRTV